MHGVFCFFLQQTWLNNMLKPSICRVVWKLYIYNYIIIYYICISYNIIYIYIYMSHRFTLSLYNIQWDMKPTDTISYSHNTKLRFVDYLTTRQSMVIGTRGWIIVGLAMYHIIFTWLVSNMFV